MSIVDMKFKKTPQNITTSALGAVTIIFAISQTITGINYARLNTQYDSQKEINTQLTAMLEASANGDASAATQSASRPRRGSWTALPPEVAEQIEGSSLMPDSPVSVTDLAYLTLPYCDFDGQVSIGHMICNKEIADEVLDIFEELYTNTYPIKSVEIAEAFADKQTTVLTSLEAASKGSNNTTCFMYRKHGEEFDKSAYGLAIDINPMLNPDTSGEDTMPRNAIRYKDRENAQLTYTEGWAFIKEGSDIIKTFEKYGWKWCGSEGKYGRFEKQ